MQLQQVLEVGDHGIEGTVGVIGRTAKGNTRQALGAHLRPQPLHQGRLANTGLAAEEDHLSQPSFALVPEAAQESTLLFPPHQHQHQHRSSHKLLVAAGGLSQATYTAHRHWLGNAMERMRPKVFQGKGALGQPRRHSADDHRVGRGEAFEPCRNVGRFPERQVLVSPTTPIAPTTTGPVWMPSRTASWTWYCAAKRVFSVAMAWTIPRPVCTARRASSSWATG